MIFDRAFGERWVATSIRRHAHKVVPHQSQSETWTAESTRLELGLGIHQPGTARVAGERRAIRLS